jgi:hypothetical protein
MHTADILDRAMAVTGLKEDPILLRRKNGC